MGVKVGIRREDKNRWERRVPLTPADLSSLVSDHGVDFLVQPSPIRVFTDDDYRDAGVTVSEDLDPAGLVFAVKEIPIDLFRPGRAYVYFSHVIKGQAYNMPMLSRLLELGCTLIDYEKITDDQKRRLIFFSIHAGYAGTIETLRAFGLRLEAQGRRTPLAEIKQAWQYGDLDEAKAHLRDIGERITADGLGEGVDPLIIGIAGYGNVARGCQEILACLPVTEVAVADLPSAAARGAAEGPALMSVTFREEDMVRPVAADGVFELNDYYANPEKYAGRFEDHLPHLDILLNGIYWEDRYPRLVTRRWTADNYGPGRKPRLQVIGDISCDIEGSVELTLKAPMPENPTFVFDPVTGAVKDGIWDGEGCGPAIMAVDNLPCELPRESSQHFSKVLRDMVPPMAAADWELPFAELELPDCIKRAIITHRGELTPDFEYLSEFLSGQ